MISAVRDGRRQSKRAARLGCPLPVVGNFRQRSISMATLTTDWLNGLLRGELAATETYQQALEKLGDERGADMLRKIHVDHREAANAVRLHVRDFGEKPDTSSGAWGAFAKAVEGTATLLGND